MRITTKNFCAIGDLFMKPEVKDLEKIIEYCDRIGDYIRMYGGDEEDFLDDRVFQEGTAFCLIQIGEAVVRLPEHVRALNKDVDWNGIKGFRNVLVHRYGTIWMDNVWRTITVSVPSLKEACESMLKTIDQNSKE